MIINQIWILFKLVKRLNRVRFMKINGKIN